MQHRPLRSVEELGAFLRREGLARLKWPERIEVVSELPLKKAGKLDKPALKVPSARKLAVDAAEMVAILDSTEPNVLAVNPGDKS